MFQFLPVLGRVIAVALSLFLLNQSLTFENVWPTPKVRWGSTLSIELAIVVLLLATLHGRAQTLARRVLPAIWIVLVAGRYLAVTAVGLYGRDFNLYWDSQHLGNVAGMMLEVAPWWLVGLVVAAFVGGIGAAYLLARLAFSQIAAAVQHVGGRRTLGALAALFIAVFTVQMSGEQPSDPREMRPFTSPVTPAFVRQVRYVAGMIGAPAISPSLGPSPAFDSSLSAIEGDDVLLVFAESYGAITFEVPEIADGLAESRTELEAAVHETGRQVVSAFIDSPTFGGGSWLAHLTLLSGIDVRDQYAYTSLMASSRETLLGNFKRSGYRTVALMPGMRQPWPEGAFYGFDEIYGRAALDYRGPQFGWWSIPDQYALAKLDQLERGGHPRAPRFVVFPTSTTHAPFGPVAPYQPDWSRLLTDQPYDEEEARAALAAVPDLTNMAPSYVKAMAYEYLSFAGYLRQHDDGFVLIIVGDHQPPAAVSGPGAPWHVPVHVITSRSAVIDRLLEFGFVRGLTPSRPPLAPMHSLTTILLDAFDGETQRRPPVRFVSQDDERR